VEIGPGTGQATQPLAERGFEVTGVELGEQLAAAARSKLSRFPNVEIVTANFETWEPEVAGFDAIAFTAFHWIDPDLRFEKPARLLRRGGALAVVAPKHVLAAGSDSFWVEVQADYDAVVPGHDNQPPPAPEDVADLSDEIDASGVLRTVAVRRYSWDLSYTANEYLAVLDTYSGHRTIEETKRRELYERIRRRIEERPGRSVRQTRLAMLNVARRP
jgi:SAM-dependent methyltransferase